MRCCDRWAWLDTVRAQRGSLERELGDPVEARAEREGLEHAITQATREHTALRNELAERELQTPGAWVRATFGERPDRPAQREAWKNGVRHAARYRAQYDITDPADALGPRPDQRGGQQRDWERAMALARVDQGRSSRHHVYAGAILVTMGGVLSYG